jgi:hypothetical protein
MIRARHVRALLAVALGVGFMLTVVPSKAQDLNQLLRCKEYCRQQYSCTALPPGAEMRHCYADQNACFRRCTD